jgi:hypothetical protein
VDLQQEGIGFVGDPEEVDALDHFPQGGSDVL